MAQTRIPKAQLDSTLASIGGDLGGTGSSPTVPELVSRKYGNLTIIGHSYTAGTTQLDSGVTNVYQESLVSKLQSMLGISEQNVTHLGQASSYLTGQTDLTGTAFSGWSGALQFIVPNNSTNINAPSDVVVTDPPVASVGLNTIIHGVNDVGLQYATSSPVAAAQPTYIQNAYSHALRSTIARMRMGVLHDASVVAGTITWDGTLSFAGGTWSNQASVTQNSGAAYKQSTTNNDTIVYTIPTNFIGGYVDLSFIGQQGGLTTLTTSGGTINGTSGTTGVAMAVANGLQFPSSNGFVVIMGTEQILVTGGAGTNSWTVTRAFNSTAATTHAAGDVVLMAQNMQVAYSTNGSNAIITGTTKLGGQGVNAKPVAIVKRFLCTTADAGKTITMTFSGIPASDTFSAFWFDSVGLEAPDPPTVVITNLHPWNYGGYSVQTFSLASGFNTAISSVVAEFDNFVQIADVYTPFNNRGGTITASMNNTDVSTAIGWTCNSSSFTPTVGMMFSFGKVGAEHALVTAVSGSAPNWTLTLTRGSQSTAKAAHSSGDFLAPLAWMSQVDDVHLSNFGHAVYATVIYNALKSVTTNTSYQQALNDGNWSQTSQSFAMGITDASWNYPQTTGSPTSGTVTQNKQTAFPIYVPKMSILTALAAPPRASSSGVLRYGIYFPDITNSRPGRLLQDFGAYTYTTTTAWSTTGLYQIVRPGWYWLSVVQQATAIAMNVMGGASSLAWPPLNSIITPVAGAGFTNLSGYFQTGISGALADWPIAALNEGTTGASGIIYMAYLLRTVNRA